MGNLDEQINKFLKSDKFKKELHKKMTTNPNFGDGTSEKSALTIGNRLKEILREEILTIRSKTTGEAFLDFINVDTYFKKGTGWVSEVSFDYESVQRSSLYQEKYSEAVYLPVLFNDGYKAKGMVYGSDRHGNSSVSLTERDGLEFIQKAVNRFNEEMKDTAKAEYNSIYNGGTLE